MYSYSVIVQLLCDCTVIALLYSYCIIVQLLTYQITSGVMLNGNNMYMY